MKHGKAPAFQFYANDFLKGTHTMSAAEVGIYIRLLASSWDDPLPLEEVKLARIAGVTLSQFRKAWATIGSKWRCDGNTWLNDRLEQTRTELASYHRRQSDRGKAGAHIKWARWIDGGNDGASMIPATPNTPISDGRNDSSNDGSSIFNLQSSEDQPHEEQDRGADLPRAREDGRIVADGVAWNPAGRRRTSALIGDHRRCDPIAAAACARGICVPAFLVGQWRSQFGLETPHAADEAVKAFVWRVVGPLPSGPVGDEPLKFWRAAWATEHGVQAAMPVAGKGNATRDAVARTIAKRAARLKDLP